VCPVAGSACSSQTECPSGCHCPTAAATAASESEGIVRLASLDDSAQAEGQEKAKKIRCPVMGETVDRSVWLEVKGAKVYFCCAECVDTFKKDPAKYAAKANLQLVFTGQFVQKGCPLTGRPINPEQQVKFWGVNVNFCCGGCRGKVTAADEAGRLAMLFGEEAFGKGFERKKEKSESAQ